MPRATIAMAVLGMLLAPLAAQADCHHRRLDKVTEHGKTVELDDGSLWEVSDYDRSEAEAWEQDAPITACEGELVNREVHETAQAREIQRGDPVPDTN